MTEPQPITVRSLAKLLRRWPRTGAQGLPSLVMIADRYRGTPVPAEGACAIESDDGGRMHLVLQPYVVGYDPGSGAPNATAIDLALAALQYRLTTPFESLDPSEEQALTVRAVDALLELKNALRMAL